MVHSALSSAMIPRDHLLQGEILSSARWAPEQERQLTDLWADIDLSASQIAERIGGGTTRNAVLGKANRMIRKGQLAARGNFPWQQKLRHERVSPSLGMRRRSRRKTMAHPPLFDIPPSEPLLEPEFQQAEPDMPRMEIAELKGRDPSGPGEYSCRWPLDDPPANNARQTYCGKPHVTGSAYCMFHFLKSRHLRHG